MRADRIFLGVDIGGSSVKLGTVTAAGRVLSRRMKELDVTRGRDVVLELIFSEIAACLQETGQPAETLHGIGVAAPGTLDVARGIILQPYNLPGWENLPLRKIVADRLGATTVLVNDANAAAYGEYWVGAGREYRSLMLWTMGTGIGGGIVLDGELLVGAHGHAGECGHIIIQCDGGPRSSHGIHGSLELYAGARSLLRRCKERLAAGSESSLTQRDDSTPLTPRDIADAAEAGDALCIELILETARYLAVGTVNVMHMINPEVVVIGGAMTFGREQSVMGQRFIQEVRARVKEIAFPIPAERTRIEYASLGNDAGFIGAAGCAFRASQSGPLT